MEAGDLDGRIFARFWDRERNLKFFFRNFNNSVRTSVNSLWFNLLRSLPPPLFFVFLSPRISSEGSFFFAIFPQSFYLSPCSPPLFFSSESRFDQSWKFSRLSFLRSVSPGARQNRTFFLLTYIFTAITSTLSPFRERDQRLLSDRTDHSWTRHLGRKILSPNIDIFTVCGFLWITLIACDCWYLQR